MKRLLPWVLIPALHAPLGGASTVVPPVGPLMFGAESPGKGQGIASVEGRNLAQALHKLKVADTPIGPLDLLEVRVYQEEDLRREVRVSESGFITFPLVGRVKVAGKTVAEAERTIAESLAKDYLVDPQVSIVVKESQDKRVFILGEVRRPASYALPMDRQLTVVQAISQAGGFTELAASDRTSVIRVREGATERITVKVSEITRHGDRKKDIPVLPNDIIYVPEVFF